MKRLLLLPLCFCAGFLALADTVVLKSGEKIEGRVRSETDDAVTMEVTINGVVDERVVDKSQIAEMNRVEADDRQFDQLKALKPDPQMSKPSAVYERWIIALRAFGERFPESSHLNEIRANLAALEAEKARVDTGEVKYLGEWLSVADSDKRKPQFDAVQLFESMSEASARGDYTGALNAFDLIEKSFGGTRAYPPAVELAQRLVATLRGEIERLRTTLKQNEEEYKKGLAITTDSRKAALRNAKNQEMTADAAALAAATQAGQKWVPLIPRSAKSLDALTTTVTAEVPRLAALDLEAMRRSLETSGEAVRALYDAKIPEAEAKAREAQQLWNTNEETAFVTGEVARLKSPVVAQPSAAARAPAAQVKVQAAPTPMMVVQASPTPAPVAVTPKPKPVATATPAPTMKPKPTPTPTPAQRSETIATAMSSMQESDQAPAAEAAAKVHHAFFMTIPGAGLIVLIAIIFASVVGKVEERRAAAVEVVERGDE